VEGLHHPLDRLEELDRAEPEPRLGILRVRLQGGDQGGLPLGERALHEVRLGQGRTIGRGVRRGRQACDEDQSEGAGGSHGSCLREREDGSGSDHPVFPDECGPATIAKIRAMMTAE
jgi:hypothetical protein